MKNVMRNKITTLVLSIALLSALPGCVLAAVGAGAALGVIYIQGEHHTDVPVTPSDAIVAVNATVEAQGYILISSEADDLGAEVVARTTDDAMVRVRLQRLASGHSRVWVRIGALGQESLSNELLLAIKERIEAPGPRKAAKRSAKGGKKSKKAGTVKVAANSKR